MSGRLTAAGWRTEASLRHEAWLTQHGIPLPTLPPRDYNEILDAWDTLAPDTQQQALKHARRRRGDAELRQLELLEAFMNGDSGMTTIRTSTTEGTVGALKWKRTEVSFRYDPQLTDLLKNTVPGDFRDWDPGRKVWIVKGVYYIEVFLKAARKRGHDVLEPIERGL